MKLLGMVEFGTNKRMTLPKKVVELLGLESGDFIIFYEDKGAVVMKTEAEITKAEKR